MPFDFLQPQADLSARNTLALPARAKWLATVTQTGQLAVLATHPEFRSLPRLALGCGSNLVFSGDFQGTMIAIALKGREYLRADDTAHYVAAAAGENWHDFVQWTLAQGWPGLENLVHIPGTVGAAPIQNIGAYGMEAGSLIDSLEVADMATGGEIRRFAATDCAFGYRQSIFKREGWHRTGRCVITRVIFRLPKHWQPHTAYGEVAAELARAGVTRPDPLQMAATIADLRRRKLPDPATLPNAGSFFQNPVVSAEFAAALASAHPDLPRHPQPDGNVKLSAGWLIEQVGWKGRNLGRVGMYEKQALILVNRGGANGRDVLNLGRAVREAVFARFGVQLVPEPVIVGGARS
ncbi:MAG: UDP-N-acetylmuramate dehydrogenase [Zoogloeaceae bacterium]|jgi:UDP-N-acetylmuramate dehydrogenase|nr:UDP-N-acetylmuramate dehydrogenase [Zoogloeaceae bacterium]